MKFSIIIPSYNQDQFIDQTFENIKILKERANVENILIEVLLFDSCSNEKVQRSIKKYEPIFDFFEIKKDNGQYHAINKGMAKVTGDYWTWLNTDDLIDVEGFLKLAAVLKNNPSIEYIYGGIRHIDKHGDFIRDVATKNISLNSLVNINPGIYQPGSFMKRSFTNKIGVLEKYNCCFDYEYILRILKNYGEVYVCNFIVSSFRIHETSKTGSIIPVFVREQLEISKKYGRKILSKHTLIANLRLLKHHFFK